MIGDVLGIIGTGFQVGGAIAGWFGGEQQAEGFEQQQAFTLQLGQQKADWARELAETEAELILQRGEDVAEVAAWNARQAGDNAAFAARAGAIELADSERRWTEHIKMVTAQFAASGVLLTDTPTAVIAEQYAEAAKDGYRIKLNTENAVRRSQGEADLYTLEGSLARARAEREAKARRRAGEIEAGSSLLQSRIGADTAGIQADTARFSGLTSLLGGFGRAAESFLSFVE